MNVEQSIRAAIREYNADLSLRSWIALGMGFLTSMLVLGVLMLVCFSMLYRGPWLWVALGLFGVFMLASLWSVRRGYEPEVDVGPLSNSDLGLAAIAFASTGFIGSPRHTIAGFAGILMHGPACLLESLSLRRAMLPAGGQIVSEAARMLERMPGDGGLTPRPEDGNVAAALVLVKLRLLRLDAELTRGRPMVDRSAKSSQAPDLRALRLVLTQKGRAVADGTEPAGRPDRRS